jgi:hypothetical protein
MYKQLYTDMLERIQNDEEMIKAMLPSKPTDNSAFLHLLHDHLHGCAGLLILLIEREGD